MWLVLLRYAKDRFLGVDPLEQLVSPRVWFWTTYLLIRDVIGSLSCLEAWGMVLCLACEPHGARGAYVGEILALQEGPLLGKP
jgi:hypothetical protein